MDRKEAIRKFVKEKLKLLLSDPFYERVYHEDKKRFFDPIKKSTGLVKDSEIAEDLVDYLIKTKQIRNNDELSKKSKLPFLAKNIIDQDYFRQKLEMENKGADVDVSALDREEYKQRKIEELRKEALDDKLEGMDRAIEEKQKQYDSVPSVLDEIEYLEPATIDEQPETTEDIHWYKLLNLRRDPFPSIRGLDGIPEDDYEDIVVRTRIYKIVIDRTYLPTELFRNMVLYGQFGSGKTTLFQYLQKPLITRRIFPIYITLSAQSEFQSFLVRFKERLIRELRRIYGNITGSDLDLPFQSPLDDQLRSAITQIVGTGKCFGFVIFVDDIYKIPEYEQIALNFLSHLQVFRTELIQDTGFNQICFWVSAPPHWERTLMHDLRYSGSVDLEEQMSKITVQEATAMINNRLRTFAENPADVKQFDQKFIEQLYRRLESSDRWTFRQIIKEVRYQFQQHNFEMVASNPVDIPPRILQHIKYRFDYADAITDGIEHILQLQMRPNNKVACFKLLMQTLFAGSIDEASELFRAHLYHFQKLRDAQLIRKVKTNDERRIWKPSIELIRFIDLIKKETKYSFEDYFFRLYGSRLSVATNPATNAIRSEVGTSSMLLNEIRDDLQFEEIYSFVSQAFDLHKKIVDLQQSTTINVDEESLIRDCNQSLIFLTRAVAKLFKTEDPTSLSFWNSFWIYPDSVSIYVKLVDRNHSEKEDERNGLTTDIWYTVSAYTNAFGEILEFLHEQVHQSRIFTFTTESLKSSDADELVRIRSLIGNKNYPEASSSLVSFIETKTQVFLHNIFSLQNGERFSIMKRLPENIRKQILESAHQSDDENEFRSLQIEQFASIMTSQTPIGHMNWIHTFSQIFEKWNEEQMQEFFNHLSSMTSSSSGSSQSNNEIGLSRIITAIAESVDFIGMINGSYRVILSHLKKIDNDGSTIFKYYYSLDEGKHIEELEPVIIPPEIEIKLIEIWKQAKMNTIDLANPEQIRHLYGIPYRELVAILAKVLQNDMCQAGITASVIKEKASELVVKVE